MMHDHDIVVFGVYGSVDAANHAVNQLIAARLSNSELSLITSCRMPPGFLFDPALSVSGVGPFVGAGPLAAALARVTSQGAGSGIVDALVRVGFPYPEALRFEEQLTDGAVLLGVHCDALDETARAQHILKISGANDISSAGPEIVTARPITRA